MVKFILINKNKKLVEFLKLIPQDYLLKTDYFNDKIVTDAKISNLQTQFNELTNQFNEYKTSINMQIQDLYNKYASLLDLINLDEETLRKLKEALDLITSENLVARMKKLEEIQIQTYIASGSGKNLELKQINNIIFKQNFAVDDSMSDSQIVLNVPKYIENGLIDNIYGVNIIIDKKESEEF